MALTLPQTRMGLQATVGRNQLGQLPPLFPSFHGPKPAVAPHCGATHQNAGRSSVRMSSQGNNSMRDVSASVASTVTTETIAPPSTSTKEDSSPAGKVDWLNAWYPVAFTADLPKNKPYRFILMEQPLVIWWDPKGHTWRVQADLCPHRLVPMSEGRINDKGNLECGYHAWEFDGSGACVSIPTGGNTASPRACLANYPAAERQGLLFVRANPLPRGIKQEDSASGVDLSTIPIVPELEDPTWFSQDTWRDLPYDYSTLMENVTDSSHVPFTHHKSISNRGTIGQFKLTLDAPVTVDGFSGSWPMGPRAGMMGSQYTEFTGPCYLKHTLDAAEKRGFKSQTIVYAVPISPGRTRVINRNTVRFEKTSLPAKVLRKLPGWWSHVGSHTPLEDDQIFLHLGEEEYLRRRAEGKTTSAAYFLGSPADALVAAYRSWLERFGNGGPWGPPNKDLLARWPARQGREALLDRWTSHTANCEQCQRGLALMTQWRDTAGTVQALAAGATVLTLAVALASVTLPAEPLAAAASAAAGSAAAASGGLAAVLSSLTEAVASTVLNIVGAVVGPGPAGSQALRALVWAAVAAAAGSFKAWTARNRERFFKGEYPPKRNIDSTPVRIVTGEGVAAKPVKESQRTN